MRDASVRLSALLLLAVCGAATAEGEGNNGTDRSNKPKSVAICRTGEHAVAVPQADGKIVWKCAPGTAAA